MSNYRSLDLLRLAYELDCTIKVPDVCTGGTGEPCHANQAIWGKGGAMKAHDFAFASGCRACHTAIDQGSKLPDHLREFYWLRGHVETMRQLWTRGLLVATRYCPPTLKRKKRATATADALMGVFGYKRAKGSKRGTHTTKPDKCRIGWTQYDAESSN